jgi:NhaP-type Na+/H+ or K+/H+ antiporter
VTLGALVTAAGGAVAARLTMAWDWRLCILFGTLVIVTGPTVVTPLLRRLRVRADLTTVLEAEGIFIDAVGATIAVAALEVALVPSRESLTLGVVNMGLRIGFGAAVGMVGGTVLALLLRWRNVVPSGLENVLSLAFAVTTFHVSDGIMQHSGITAAIVAGMVLGNTRGHAHDDLVRFKEQLTVLFVATLFILLCADVRIADVAALGAPGIATVVLLIVGVRPLTIAACTYGTDLGRRGKILLSWIAPRGIIAAAVASLFAEELEAAGIEGGVELRALVFLVIAATVAFSGLTAGLAARFLGLLRPQGVGHVILGANAVGRRIGEVIARCGEEVVIIDANDEACRIAEDAGFRIVYGNALEDRTLGRASVADRATAIAVGESESINLLFARRVHERFQGPQIYVALETETFGATQPMVDQLGAHVLFGGAQRLDRWRHHLRGRTPKMGRWRYSPTRSKRKHVPNPLGAPEGLLLPLAGVRAKKPLIAGPRTRIRKGDEMVFAYTPQKVDEAHAWLTGAGWESLEAPTGDQTE